MDGQLSKFVLAVFFLLATMIVHGTAHAHVYSPDPDAIVRASGFRADIYVGGSYNHTNTSKLTITPVFIDTLKGDEGRVDFLPGVGVAYDFAITTTPEMILTHFVRDISVGLNYFYLSSNRDGRVWQFGLPQLNNFKYDMDITSQRLMLDGELTLNPMWRNLSFFALLGIGVAQNEVDYKDHSVVNTQLGGIRLGSDKDYQLAFDAGFGLKLPFSKKLEASARYLYTYLGDAQTQRVGNIALLKPVKMNLESHSLLFGLSYYLG